MTRAQTQIAPSGYVRVQHEGKIKYYACGYRNMFTNTAVTAARSRWSAASNGGAAAVPGIGGLAGLAMGAAGLRRKRQRVA